MERYNAWARNIETGVPAGGATVGVKIQGTDTLATLFSDDGVTPMANPTTADATTGIFAFYAANGRYAVTVTPESGEGDAYTVSDVLLYDPEDV